METAELERVLTFAIEHRDKAQEVFNPEKPWDKWRSWPEAMADGFTHIEKHHLSTHLVFVHPDHLINLLNALSHCVVVNSVDGEPAADLWGAEVWADPRIPKEIILCTAKPKDVHKNEESPYTPLHCLSCVNPPDKGVFGDDP